MYCNDTQKSFGSKIRDITTVLYCLDIDNFDFTRKIAEIILKQKFVKLLWICFCTLLNSSTLIDFTRKIANKFKLPGLRS